MLDNERQVGTEIEVTPEMVEAGLGVLAASGIVEELMCSDSLLVEEIFIAMADKSKQT